jgi:hypothetical protein
MTASTTTPALTAQTLAAASLLRSPAFNPYLSGNSFAPTVGMTNPYLGSSAYSGGGRSGYGSGMSTGSGYGSGGYGNSGSRYPVDPVGDSQTATNTPTQEDERNPTPARRDPEPSDVASGQALNHVLDDVTTRQGKGGRGPEVPLDEALLGRINVSGGIGGDVGLLRDGKLEWPVGLCCAGTGELRRRVGELTAEAVRLARSDKPVEAGVIKGLTIGLEQLRASLRENIGDLSPAEYLEADHFLNRFGSSVRALYDPQVGNYFHKQWSARGRTVADLVRNMEGLRFAPAAPGDEGAYRGVYRALVAFEAGLTESPR